MLGFGDKWARFNIDVWDVQTGELLGTAVVNGAALSDGCAGFWATGEVPGLHGLIGRVLVGHVDKEPGVGTWTCGGGTGRPQTVLWEGEGSCLGAQWGL